MHRPVARLSAVRAIAAHALRSTAIKLAALQFYVLSYHYIKYIVLYIYQIGVGREGCPICSGRGTMTDQGHLFAYAAQGFRGRVAASGLRD